MAGACPGTREQALILDPTWLSFPRNALLLAVLVMGQGAIWIRWHRHPAVRFFSGGKFALISIAAVLVLCMALGFFPQHWLGGVRTSLPSAVPGALVQLGLHDLTRSPWFLVALSALWCSLGFACWRRILPLDGPRKPFLLVHVGLWIALSAAAVGSADLQRLRMTVWEGDWAWVALDGKGDSLAAPLALRLEKFTLEEYPPRIGIIDPVTGLALKESGKPIVFDMSMNSIQLADFRLHPIQYLPMAGMIGDGMAAANEPGLPAALHLSILYPDGHRDTQWISTPSWRQPPVVHNLTPTAQLALLEPQARDYRSQFSLIVPGDTAPSPLAVGINHPAKVRGWKVYQLGYDEKKGRWSQTSIVELVRDPWLPGVYVGMLLAVLGILPLARPIRKEPK